MKIAAISDTHGHLPRVPECDVFIHAGDWTPVHNHSRGFQKDWVKNVLSQWSMEVDPETYILAIAGNHDFVARSDDDFVRKNVYWDYLNNESREINGVKFWGSPYSLTFGNWAFMRDEEGLSEIWQTIPDDVNVLIVHGPPYGYGDKCMYYEGSDPHQGSRTLIQRISELSELELVLFGHIHESAGVYENPYCKMANLSYVDLSYIPRNNIMEFEIYGNFLK